MKFVLFSYAAKIIFSQIIGSTFVSFLLLLINKIYLHDKNFTFISSTRLAPYDEIANSTSDELL
jgi:hypothetical protein